ncbi:ABC-F family ATP-binding cassette domain-containing protein [Nocardia asiatica]|uniref:ABC-F family ATP-binding cassette domain-containing protein n=1 Tax=Nocardia asiatica TaxID=209252 RepID=UPI002453DCE3|nr:ABC-F family ATP-binding cassette domain-containing protein [Nocardia asiatica]
MATSTHSAIKLHSLTFEWPDGTVALAQLNGVFGAGRTGLVGRNGAGKSTLLRLIAGFLTPTSGRIEVAGEVGYLPQTLTLDHDTTLAELLGIADTLTALRAIESGDTDERHFEAVGDNWDIEARANEALHEIGFTAADLDRRVDEISGGQAVLAAVTGLRIRRTPITLLDEPTNNLDRVTRAQLGAFVDTWPGTLVVVSHDLELLEHMESTAELHAAAVEVFGGPYSAWRQHLERRQAAAVQAARTAEQALKTEKRQRIEAETKLARRERTARATQQHGGIPRILAGNRAGKAQASAGAMRTGLDARVRTAREALADAESRVRREEHIHLDLPDPDVPRGRRIAELRDGDHAFVIQGPERVALVGPNGAGKSTLIEYLLGTRTRTPGTVTGALFTDRVGYLPQRLDGLAEECGAIDNVRAVATTTPRAAIRNQLARLLLRGDSVDRPVSTLSGGERFRVSLARLLLADPPAQLLILDEPTNNLDIASVEQLIEALAGYRGAVFIVSHDHPFLARIGIDTILELSPDGRLRQRGGLEEIGH